MRVVKFIITEPWEYAFEKSVDASILRKKNEQYLINLSKPVKIKGKDVHYFIAVLREMGVVDNLCTAEPGEYLLNMVYAKDVDESNFGDYKIEEFRSGFLIGEVALF